MNSRAPVAAAAALSLLLLSASPASAATTRIAGDDRYETAADISFATFEPNVSDVYIATGESYADALAGGAAAAQDGGPILLVTRTDIPDDTVAELQRLAPTGQVKVLGGSAAISDQVVDELEELASAEVVRIAGENRYTTSVLVSDQAFEPGVSTVVVAGGEGFADALAAAPAAAQGQGPVLLVEPNDIPSTVAAELERLQPAEIVIAGGTGSVSAAVEDELAGFADRVTRLAGSDRYRTAVAISAATFDAPKDVVYLASGATFADALAGGPAAALADAPILLVPSNCIPRVVQDEIDRLEAENIVLFGGPGTLGAGVEGGDVCEDLAG